MRMVLKRMLDLCQNMRIYQIIALGDRDTAIRGHVTRPVLPAQRCVACMCFPSIKA
jgi:hypothetical protein